MRDLTFLGVVHHTQARRLKLLFVLSVSLRICGSYDHTNVLGGHTRLITNTLEYFHS